MTSSIVSWWRTLSLREKRLILVMLALLAGVIVWLGIVRPVNDASAAAQAANLVAADQAAQVSAGVAVLRSGGGLAAPLEAPLDRVVGQSAADAGFTLDANTAQGTDGVSISIGSARASALFAWLASLEARGVVIESLTVQPGTNNLVSAQATLRSVSGA